MSQEKKEKENLEEKNKESKLKKEHIEDETIDDSSKENQKANENEENLKIMLQSLQADFENYRKRKEKEKEEIQKFSNSELIKKILPILDLFELALNESQNNTNETNNDKETDEHIDRSNNKKHENFVKGVELIYAQLFQTLEHEGLKVIDPKNEQFDPYKHEAIMQANENDKENNKVLEVFQKGYDLNGRILRHAKVKVNKNN